MFFVGGLLTGIAIFGETSSRFVHFWGSSFMGRYTIPQLLHLSTGATVLLVIVVGLFTLWGGAQIERKARHRAGLSQMKATKWAPLGAGLLVVSAVAVLLIGQPTAADRWQRIAAEKEPLLANRQVQIHPAELRDLYYNPLVNLVMLDVRDESDYNIFHITDSRRVDLDNLESLVPELKAAPDGTVVVLMSNGETHATEGWKILVADSIPNVYILDGGINNWLAICSNSPRKHLANSGDDTLAYAFTVALGDKDPSATPRQHGKEIEYLAKVKIQKKAPSGGGGCG